MCTLAAPFAQRGRYSLFAKGGSDYSSRTIQLVQRSTVIDMLGLITLDYARLCRWLISQEEFPIAEWARLRDSGVTVIHPAVGFVGADISGSSLNDIRRWNRFIADHPKEFLRVNTPADLMDAKRSGRIGVLLGLQNSSHFTDLAAVDAYFDMGQRVSQLTYLDNALGGGSPNPARGLSVFGADVLRRMNELGMAADVSHCSDRTTLDAIGASDVPVLVTHSNCRALNPGSARCKSDEAVRKLAAKGGVIGITMVRPFVRASGAATIEHVLDHIDHVRKLVGIEHVGIGTDVDLDGRDRRQDLDGIQYSKKIFDVTEGLVRRKYTDEQIDLVLGGNFARALTAIWSGRASL